MPPSSVTVWSTVNEQSVGLLMAPFSHLSYTEGQGTVAELILDTLGVLTTCKEMLAIFRPLGHLGGQLKYSVPVKE